MLIKLLSILVLLTTISGFPYTLWGGVGEIDLTFGNNGLVSIGGDYGSWSPAGTLQHDGKIVIVGSESYHPMIARLLPDGALDETFGDAGIVLLSDYYYALHDVEIQPDGKILAVGGWSVFGDGDFFLVRLNPDGTLDTNFGNGGIVITDLCPFEEVNSIQIQSDGKIIAVGDSRDCDTEPVSFIVIRYETNGNLDSSFGDNGIVRTNFRKNSYDAAYTGALQADGKILAAGRSHFKSTEFGIMRLRPNGELDSTFGTNGFVATELPLRNAAWSIAVQDDSKIVLAGVSGSLFSLARYNPNGELDDTFGNEGVVLTDFPAAGFGSAESVILQDDKKILAAGWTIGTGSDVIRSALARYNIDGSLDITFGENGLIWTKFESPYDYWTVIEDLVTVPGGKMIAIGEYGGSAVVRYDLRYFHDDFEDGILGEVWKFQGNGIWKESDGSLMVTATNKTTALLRTGTAPCDICTIDATIETMGQENGKVSLLGWNSDNGMNSVELTVNEQSGRWLLKQRVGGVVKSKKTKFYPIEKNVPYTVKIINDGNVLNVYVNQVLIITTQKVINNSAESASGFQARRTTASFKYLYLY